MQEIHTAWDSLMDVSLLDDDSIVVSGKKKGGWRLLKYKTDDLSKVPIGATLRAEVDGTTEICWQGRLCLAVSYG